MTEIERPLLGLLLHTDGRRRLDDTVLAQLKTELDRPWGVLEAHFADRSYLLGEAFTIADLNVSAVMVWARLAQLDLTAWPCLADWLARCVARPAFKG